LIRSRRRQTRRPCRATADATRAPLPPRPRVPLSAPRPDRKHTFQPGPRWFVEAGCNPEGSPLVSVLDLEVACVPGPEAPPDAPHAGRPTCDRCVSL
jgi:hypothetical protein